MWWKQFGSWLETWWAFLDEVNEQVRPYSWFLVSLLLAAWVAALVLALIQEGVVGR
jgi:hypothetical protein